MLSAKDLQAISALMEESLGKRLKSEFGPIHERLDSLEDGQKRLEDGQKRLEDGQKKLEDRQSKLEDGQKKLEDRQSKLEDGQKKLEDGQKKLEDGQKKLEDGQRKLEDRQSKLEDGQRKLEGRVLKLENSVQKMEKDVTSINLLLENDIIPRLDTIENCYTSTYSRYQKSVDDYSRIKMDIKNLKEVTRSHSEQLAELAAR